MDCGIITSKSILLLLSLTFWAAGAALAYIGSYVIKSYNNFGTFLEDKYQMIPAAIILGSGIVMFIFGLVGCCATIRESKLGLGFFFLIIMIVFAAEVAALVLGFIYQGRIQGDLEHAMNNTFMKYDGQNPDSQGVDYLQTQLHCCGVQSYTNWTSTPWFTSHNNTVPLSCCKNTTNPECTGRMDQSNLLNTEGCEAKLERLIQDVFSYAMLVILAFAIIKFFGMLSVCVITCRSSSHRTGYEPLYA